jgi:hypothetical protein
MRKEVADLWVAALRSGDYQQTTLQLRDVDGFCCLGVLCDLHAKQTGQGKWSSDGYYNTGDETDGVIPTPEVSAWAGLGDRSPCVSVDGHGTDLITALNDDDGYTFMQIADLIESQWETL